MPPNNRPTLLLHICCGPCATTVIETLSDTYAVTGFFYNPNIHPENEYCLRKEAAETVVRSMGIPFVEGRYDPDSFYEAVIGYEKEPENGPRCEICYRLRLKETAAYAVANGFPLIASTLTVGPQKKAAVIDPIGEDVAKDAGIGFLVGDWKKRDGFRRSCELSKEFGIYRQHYCGCLFSIPKDTQ